MARSISVALVAAVVLATAAGAATAGTHRFFELPGANPPECELAAHVKGLGTFVYCLVGPAHATSVTMGPTGLLTICRGVKCMSNAPENARRLAYGKSIHADPFTCTAERTGIRCVVTRLGHGFLLSRTSLKRI